MAEERRDTAKIIRERPVLAERFEVVKLLGEGAAGAVFLVKDIQQENKEVALKILTDTEAFDENTLERFLAELNVAQNIAHNNIVSAYDFIKMKDSIAYTMEYVEGCDLATILEERLLSYDEIDRIMIQVLSALGELHRQGIMHRDVKLENVLISKDGTAKLVDLGLMKRLDADNKMTKTGILLGTAKYLSPEYIKTGEYVIESDIYAAGLMLFELLAGERRLNTLTGAEAIDYLLDTGFRVPRVSNLIRGQIPSKYEEILAKALNPNYKKRYRTAEEMLESFKQPTSYIHEDALNSVRTQLRKQCVSNDGHSTHRPLIRTGISYGNDHRKFKRSSPISMVMPLFFLGLGIAIFFFLELFVWGQAVPMNVPYGYYEGEWSNPYGAKRIVYAQVSGSGFFIALNEPRCTGGFVNPSTGIVACSDKSFKVNITEVEDDRLAGYISEAGKKGDVIFHYARR